MRVNCADKMRYNKLYIFCNSNIRTIIFHFQTFLIFNELITDINITSDPLDFLIQFILIIPQRLHLNERVLSI